MKKGLAVLLVLFMAILSLQPSVVFADEAVSEEEKEAKSEQASQGKEEVAIEDPVVVTAYRTSVSAKLNPSTTDVVDVSESVKYGDNSLLNAFDDLNGVNYQGNGMAGPTSVYIRGANSEHTLVLLDGIKINDPISTGGGFYYYDHLSLANIETLEVARGPFSSAYGSDAIGGVVNMMTQRGSGKPSVSYSQTIGSYGTYAEMFESQGEVGDLAFSCGFSREDVHHMYAAERRNGNFERDPYSNMNFSGRLDYAITDQVEVSAFGRYIRADYEYDSGANSDADQYKGDFDMYVFGTSAKHTINDYFLHTITLGYTDISRNNWTGAANNWYSGDTYQLRWDAEVTPVDWGKLQVGLDYLREAGESCYYQYWVPSYARSHENTLNTKGAFVQGILTPLENVFLSANLRVENHSRYGSQVTYGFSGSYFIEQTQTKLKSSWGTAFKSPSIYQLYDSSSGNAELNPEESRSLDVGFEQYIGEKGSCGSTFFYTNIKNLMDTTAAPYTYQNIGNARIYGWENFVAYDVHETTQLKLQYTYMQAKNKTYDERLARRPNHKLTLSVDTKYKNFSCNASLSYVGSRKDSHYSGINNKEYILGDIGVGYDITENINIFGRMHNIFDYQYVLANGYETRGRSLYGGIKLKF